MRLINILLKQSAFYQRKKLTHKALVTELLIKRAIRKQELYDFYALSLLTDPTTLNKLEASGHDIHKIVELRIQSVYTLMSKYIQEVLELIKRELKFVNGAHWPEGDGEAEQKLEALGISQHNFRNLDKVTPQAAQCMFTYLYWPNEYGGPAWAEITERYIELLKIHNELATYKHYVHKAIRAFMSGEIQWLITRAGIAIDRINQAEHNTGSLSDKLQPEDDDDRGPESWMQLLLNEKFIPGSVQILKEKTSPEIKNLLKDFPVHQQYSEQEVSGQIADNIILKLFKALMARRGINNQEINIRYPEVMSGQIELIPDNLLFTIYQDLPGNLLEITVPRILSILYNKKNNGELGQVFVDFLTKKYVVPAEIADQLVELENVTNFLINSKNFYVIDFILRNFLVKNLNDFSEPSLSFITKNLDRLISSMGGQFLTTDKKEKLLRLINSLNKRGYNLMPLINKYNLELTESEKQELYDLRMGD